jgi:CRISPR-associated protein Csm3
MKLLDIQTIEGKIVLKTGLHIGSGDMEMKIGGTDNPVIKHPHTQQPYIPGSSIKGKVRSLLEMRSDLAIPSDGEPVSYKTLLKLAEKDLSKENEELSLKTFMEIAEKIPQKNAQQFKDCVKILALFGISGADESKMKKVALGPTRVAFADCSLDQAWKEKQSDSLISLIEVKSENSIDRIKGTAKNPRFTERVPAGVSFNFLVTLKKLSGDPDDLETMLLEGLKLLEMDALGGSVSRGYGRIEFCFAKQALQDRFNDIKPLPI